MALRSMLKRAAVAAAAAAADVRKISIPTGTTDGWRVFFLCPAACCCFFSAIVRPTNRCENTEIPLHSTAGDPVMKGAGRLTKATEKRREEVGGV